MSNNPDVIGQIADKTTKLANKWADDLTNKAWDELRMLQRELQEIGLSNTDMFCEVSTRTGELTGNIVSRYVWGDYEADWAEFKNVGKPVAIDYSDDAFFELEYLMEFKFNRGEPLIMEMQKCEETITKTAWVKEFSRSDFTIE